VLDAIFIAPLIEVDVFFFFGVAFSGFPINFSSGFFLEAGKKLLG
jgi:hypothetical protein